MAYDSKIRYEAQFLMLAGHRLSEIHDILLDTFNTDVPTSTLSDWRRQTCDDGQIKAEAEEYRKKHVDLCWHNIGQANELLRRNLSSALFDRDKLESALEILKSLDNHGMFDEEYTERVKQAVDILIECKALTTTKDALAVVEKLSAQRDRSAAVASGSGASGTFQLTFTEDMEELSG